MDFLTMHGMHKLHERALSCTRACVRGADDPESEAERSAGHT